MRTMFRQSTAILSQALFVSTTVSLLYLLMLSCLSLMLNLPQVLSVVALISVLSMLAQVSDSYPSPRSLDTDISLLFDNDLWGPGSLHQESALILSKAQNHSDALRSCSSLGDRLFNATDRSLDFLQYLGHTLAKRKQRYWIAGQKGAYCNTVNYNGASRLVHCNETLPSLCSQSAPMSNAGWADLSPRWRVEVNTGNQTYQGYRDQRSFRFIGIRYALQPFRFTHSVQYDGQGVFEAINPPPWCAQEGGRGEEDCLFLNIWTPHLPLDGNSSENLRPVMFYIHGGAFMVGSGSEPNFDGGNMASRGDVVVVTINYRVGTLGFLALDDNITTGNWGLGDQVTALDWVRSHIGDFGGDPNRITIFGQSAGAASVRALLGAPQARGKYHAAIMQSGLGGLNWARTYSHYLNATEAMDVASQGILDRSWCNRGDMARKRRCLQSMKAKKIQNLRTEPARYLVIDHSYIDYHYLPLNRSSRVNSVPLLMGTMADDSTMFIPPRETKNLTKGLLGYDFNATYLIKSHQFPLNRHRNKTDAVYDVVRRASMDSMFRCLGQATAATASNYSTFPALWYYEFHRGYSRPPPREQCEPPSTKAHPDGDPTKDYLKCHSGDIIYVFGNMARSGWPIRDVHEIPFSQYILDMWTSFARHHDPNPDLNYLRARNYNESLAWFNRTGTWPKVTGGSWEEGGWRLRELKVNSTTVGFKERNQCETLQLPIDFYDMGNQTVEEAPSPTPSETGAG